MRISDWSSDVCSSDLSTTAGFVLGSFLAGRFAARHALTTMMIAGRLVACAGLVAGLGLLAVGGVSVAAIFGACVVVGVGNGLTFPSANAGALSVRQELAGSAAGLSGALLVGGGGAPAAREGTRLDCSHYRATRMEPY